ncbi:alpha/beta hydrolase [Actinocorallia sp. A-T 12471]|uniref:alpha/beta hydrolase n=1 Tax=Actinocorallia sp. A-T 12471 TaxID=3089813 RepID=UPI0029D05E52|nr:alpha/beta hydrolase [Actinocorallia sp. A-T 12471]MDX6744054.1 alpha/beta hydrolase [Actinocorallia sp. A-T 12471]
MTTAHSASGTPVGPPPPFDAELAPVLRVMNEALPPDAFADLDKLKDSFAAAVEQPSPESFSRDGAYTIEERFVPGPEGAPDIALLICLPTRVEAPYPLIYHTHGGGMVIGDNKVGLPDTLELAEGVGAAVVSVEYRLAPGTRHPGPVEDCYAGLVWAVEHAEELGVDPARVIVGGASAGGGLAAALALLARDRGGPALVGQLLMCPMIDDRNDTPSSHQMAGLGVWDRASNEAGWTALLGDARGGPDVSPYAAPARATDLSGLPPAFIDVGSAETFRDEDVAYASRIWQAGGVAELHVWPGGFHGFDGIAPHTTLSRDARAARARWLSRLLTP